MKSNRPFRLITGGSSGRIKINRTVMEVSSASGSLPVDVRVFEEDTRLALTVDSVMRHVEEHPVRLMTDILEARPAEPGTVVRKRTSWYAVVLDLDAEPMLRREWIDAAYAEVLRLAEEGGVARLGLPLLGTVHGRHPAGDSLGMLTARLRSGNFRKIQQIVIPAARDTGKTIRGLLLQMAKDSG
jgi:hypothetical protein